MRNLYVYISFNGDCEEALNFYKSVFGGNIKLLMRYSEAPGTEFANEQNKDLILHSEFESEGVGFMAADEPQEAKGNKVCLSINFDSEAEQEKIFSALSEGAEIHMPLQDTFWGAKFGILTDRFGVKWMFNFDRPS